MFNSAEGNGRTEINLTDIILNSRQIAAYCLCGYALFFAVSIAASNICLGLAFLFLLISIKNKSLHWEIPSKYFYSLVVFFGIFFCMIFISGDISQGFDRFMRFFTKLFPLVLVVLIVEDKSSLWKIFFCMCLSVGVMDIYAIIQGLQGSFRAQAFFTHPMYLAGIMVQFMPILFFLFLQAKAKLEKMFLGSLTLLSIVTLLFNGTRGAWIAIVITLFVGLLMYGEKRKRNLSIFLLGMVILAVLFVGVPQLDQRMETVTDMKYQSNSERLLMWQSAFHMFEDHPVFGVGLGQYEGNYRDHYISPLAKERGQGHAHNNVIQLLAETGIVGAGLFCFMFISFIVYSFQDWIRNSHLPALLFALATMGLFLQGLTETNFGNSVVMQYFYFLMGLYFVSRNLQNK